MTIVYVALFAFAVSIVACCDVRISPNGKDVRNTTLGYATLAFAVSQTTAHNVLVCVDSGVFTHPKAFHYDNINRKFGNFTLRGSASSNDTVGIKCFFFFFVRECVVSSYFLFSLCRFEMQNIDLFLRVCVFADDFQFV
jgi:hypothetical protein